jgi:protein TonB
MKSPISICIVLLLCFSTLASAQRELRSPEELKKENYQEVRELGSTIRVEENDSVKRVEVLPMYPGGLNGVLQFVAENTKYPKKARKKGYQGKVIVSYVIEKDGSVAEITVVKSAHELLDEAAVKMISKMDKWHPATQRGKPVRVMLLQPVAFRLE